MPFGRRRTSAWTRAPS